MRGFKDKIIIRKLSTVSGASVSVMEDGSWTVAQVDEEVRGSFHHRLMYDRNPDLGGQYGERIVAVARIPLGTPVNQGDQIVIQNNHPTLNGVYEVNAVMYTPTHLRVETRRISI